MDASNAEYLLFGLKQELTRQTPDVWESIQARIAAQAAKRLLQQLEGVPSPEGRLFAEIRDHAISESKLRGA
ncbi:hypothetical protein [Paenibacillus ginsengarvi]|uniref:Uncharacterized protein n=1 Tax=Paenibacillus ginsengarvi TaxID=400777 RepID=A0A3B0B014_9BACL|nr:hypothetical protein [Paenibacillus ginsengarvi]RKN66135.1 hypothetical protein D7M11_31545 [Paenibacillus ginsengarvi]